MPLCNVDEQMPARQRDLEDHGECLRGSTGSGWQAQAGPQVFFYLACSAA